MLQPCSSSTLAQQLTWQHAGDVVKVVCSTAGCTGGSVDGRREEWWMHCSWGTACWLAAFVYQR